MGSLFTAVATMSGVCKVHAREIFDSRGNPTVEVEITTSKGRDTPPWGGGILYTNFMMIMITMMMMVRVMMMMMTMTVMMKVTVNDDDDSDDDDNDGDMMVVVVMVMICHGGGYNDDDDDDGCHGGDDDDCLVLPRNFPSRCAFRCLHRNPRSAGAARQRPQEISWQRRVEGCAKCEQHYWSSSDSQGNVNHLISFDVCTITLSQVSSHSSAPDNFTGSVLLFMFTVS